MKSYFEDPPRRDVNSVINSTDWYWDRTCVRSPVYGGRAYDPLEQTGWRLEAQNWQNYYNCTNSVSSSYAHFFNGAFCANVDTHTYYDRNTVRGRKDGYLLGKWDWRKAGGCKSLLRFHAFLRRTLN